MLTVSEDDEDLFAAIRVGALGYVLKGGNLSELPNLLRTAVSGEPVLRGASLARVLEAFRANERSRLFNESDRVRLSTRERQVLSLLQSGATTAEIATSLYIAKVTVRSHIAAICKKLRLPDRDAALQEFRLGVTWPVTTAEGVMPDSHATP
jgi:DNA-binding NarL/FixJ family response regulator